MGTDLIGKLAPTVVTRRPPMYCYACLAATLGVEERNVRDAARTLLARNEAGFGIARRICCGCGRADELLLMKPYLLLSEDRQAVTGSRWPDGASRSAPRGSAPKS